MSDCKHENITLYADDEFNHLVGAGHRCVTCFDKFVHISELFDLQQQLDYIRSEVASMIQDEFDDYAPDMPPIRRQEFIEALKEVVNE